MRIGYFWFILEQIVIDLRNVGPSSKVMEKNYALLQNCISAFCYLYSASHLTDFRDETWMNEAEFGMKTCWFFKIIIISQSCKNGSVSYFSKTRGTAGQHGLGQEVVLECHSGPLPFPSSSRERCNIKPTDPSVIQSVNLVSLFRRKDVFVLREEIARADVGQAG